MASFKKLHDFPMGLDLFTRKGRPCHDGLTAVQMETYSNFSSNVELTAYINQFIKEKKTSTYCIYYSTATAEQDAGEVV